MEQLMKNIKNMCEDIKYLIYSYGSFEHRKNIIKMIKVLLLPHKIRKHNMINLLDDYNCVYFGSQLYPYSIEYFIHNIFNKKKQRELLNQLSSCRCCNKHIYNKNPFKLENKYKFKDDCKCYCRHLYRNVFRSLTIEDNIHVYESSDVYLSTSEFKYLKYSV